MHSEEHVMGDARRTWAAGGTSELPPSLAAVTQHNPRVLCGPRCSCSYRPDGAPKTSEDRQREEQEFFAELRSRARGA